MTQPDFDWTFEDAPLEGEARPASGSGPRPGLIVPPRPVRRPWPRWAKLVLLGLAVAAALGGYAFTRLGWLRVERQIVAEVAYDDARARAREVEAVLAAQVNNDAYWRAQRTAEVRLGLPAPLPAGNLLPTTYPAEVIAVQPLGSNLFAATVRRRYADSAGQVYPFDLVQRYVNLGPGQWARLGTDLSGLVAATIVSGQRLSATVPTNDLPWVRPALVAADQALTAACDAWQSCPPGYVLPLFFNAGAEVLNPTRPERSLSAAPAGYPLIFDLPATLPGFPPRYVLSAPQLSGRPVDAEAQAAYNRALSAQVLGFMAAKVAGSDRSGTDYFLDALVARMEVHLGLSAPVAAPLAPLSFAPADVLWSLTQQQPFNAAPAGQNERQQVFALLNLALDGQPPTIDGALLRTVHATGPEPPTFQTWLATALPADAAARASAQWVTAVQQGLGRPTPDHDWPAAAEGLGLLCADSLAIVTDGALRLVLPGFDPRSFYQADLSRSVATDHYLAVQYFRKPPLGENGYTIEAWVFDLEMGGPASFVSDNGLVVGWGADEGLYYLSLDALTSNGQSERVTPLRRYDPASGDITTIAAEIALTSNLGWSADRRALLFTQEITRADTGVVGYAPKLLTLGPPPAIRPLAEQGSSAVFAPGSTAGQGTVAYLRAVFGGPVRSLELHLLDLASGADRLLFDSTQAGGDPIADGYQLLWSPDGSTLTFMAFDGRGTRLFTVAAGTGAWREWLLARTPSTSFVPVGFAADSAYLAAQGFTGVESLVYALLDLAAPDSAAPRILNGTDLAWAPRGHTLALSNALGVFLVDAATGAYQWLQAEPCSLSWPT